VRLNYEIATTSRIALRIYDRSGRLVAVPTNGKVSPGQHSLTWRATDGAGRPVAPGVYFCRLLNFDSGASSVQKLTLVR